MFSFIELLVYATLLISAPITLSQRPAPPESPVLSDQVLAAEIMQYPTAIRTASIRAMLKGGTAENLSFSPPQDIQTGKEKFEIFSSDNGAPYTPLPKNAVADGADPHWVISGQLALPDIGTTAADIIFFAPNLRKGVCLEIVKTYGRGTSQIPTVSRADLKDLYSISKAHKDTRPSVNGASMTLPKNPVSLQDDNATLNGQPYGCFHHTSDGTYTAYSVILER